MYSNGDSKRSIQKRQKNTAENLELVGYKCETPKTSKNSNSSLLSPKISSL